MNIFLLCLASFLLGMIAVIGIWSFVAFRRTFVAMKRELQSQI